MSNNNNKPNYYLNNQNWLNKANEKHNSGAGAIATGATIGTMLGGPVGGIIGGGVGLLLSSLSKEKNKK